MQQNRMRFLLLTSLIEPRRLACFSTSSTGNKRCTALTSPAGGMVPLADLARSEDKACRRFACRQKAMFKSICNEASALATVW